MLSVYITCYLFAPFSRVQSYKKLKIRSLIRSRRSLYIDLRETITDLILIRLIKKNPCELWMWPSSIAWVDVEKISWRRGGPPLLDNPLFLFYSCLYGYRTNFDFLEAGNFTTFLIQQMRMIHVLFDVMHFNWSKN